MLNFKTLTHTAIYIAFIHILSTAFLYAQSDSTKHCMDIGTNFWFLAPAWSGETPFIDNVPENHYTNEVNVWNQTFLDEIDHYASLRFMDWALTNNWDGSSWSERRLPDDPDNFGDQTIGAKDGIPGMAYEWMIDLCNRAQSDLWICLPYAANDNFMKECAKLVKNNLDSGLNVYLELGNELWNFQQAQSFAKAQGAALNLEDPGSPDDDFLTGMRWQAYRSAQMWHFWEEEFGEDSSRVINVLSGQSTNSWITENAHLGPLFNEEGFNPTNAYPEVYAIAPYFGGHGLDGASANIFDLLRTDIFSHRWNNPSSSSRLDNVQSHYAIAHDQYGIDLAAYEGGQHLAEHAAAPNRDAEMYEVYMEYLSAVAPYFTMFSHYTNVSTYGDGGSWGAKEYTGQPIEDAHKYRAINDWINHYGCMTGACSFNSSKTIHEFGKDAGNTTITVSSDTTGGAFIVNDDKSWISTEKDGNNITISVTENTEETSREGIVIVTGCKTEVINIKQQGKGATGSEGSCATGHARFKQSGEMVIMEAENYEDKDQNKDFVNWKEGSEEGGFSGTGYVHIEEGSTSSDNGNISDNAYLSYNIEFTEAGNYTIWLRRWAADAAGNSVYTSFEGTESAGNDNTSDYTEWLWKSTGTATVSGPGIYNLKLIRREDGYLVDKIILTSGDQPTGTGAEETRCERITFLEQTLPESLIKLYPNPANGNIINIELQSDIIQELKIYNLTGNLVYANPNPSENVQINTKLFENGVYLLKAMAKNKTINRKFVIQ